jgi:hypothetical protein
VVPIGIQGVGIVGALEFQSKILSRKTSPEEYRIYRAGLEWDLTDPIVIESPDDFKSTQRWRDRLTPYHHQVSNLITFCRRLPVAVASAKSDKVMGSEADWKRSRRR